VEDEVAARIRAGEVAPGEAGPAYREALAKNLATFSSRANVDSATLSLPWERGRSYADIQQDIFLLYFLFMIIVAAGVQLAVSIDRRSEILALQNRVREVVAGGGDLRTRLSLRSMDDFGELTELINRLLDQFSAVVGSIGGQAARTKEGAAAIARVLGEAESLSQRSAKAFLGLKSGIEAEAAESRKLRDELESFRRAVAKVDEAARAQDDYVSVTSAAMEEMSSSIR
jgi:methyl-accepting chemotaxis protein